MAKDKHFQWAGGGIRVPRFAFEAVDQTGVLVRGTLEAATERLVLDRLTAQGQTPVSLRRKRDMSPFWNRLRSHVGLGAIDFAAFLKEFSTLLKAGLPVERALVTIRSSSANGRVQLTAQQLLDRIRGGEPLSRAFLATITEAPPHIGRLLFAGEASGHLPDVMERVAAGLARTKALKSQLVSDLTYPAILFLAMGIVVWIVFHTVLPRLTPMFSDAGVRLPVATQILIAVGTFFDRFGWPLVLLIVVGIGAFLYALRRPWFRLQFDRWLLRSRLFFGIPRELEAALFCRNIETMLDGGLPLERALAVAQDGIANRYLRMQIQDVTKSVSEGRRLSQSFKACAPVLPPLVVEFAAVGEETGKLSTMMRELSTLLDQAVQLRLGRISTLIVPVTTLITGMLVGGLMAGIVSGILAVNDLAR